jgi:hypothetical protein
MIMSSNIKPASDAVVVNAVAASPVGMQHRVLRSSTHMRQLRLRSATSCSSVNAVVVWAGTVRIWGMQQ